MEKPQELHQKADVFQVEDERFEEPHNGNKKFGRRDESTFIPPPRCKKEHGKYLPVMEFNIDHLPEECRDEEVFELIKRIADICVKVTIRTISSRRPLYLPDTGIRYPRPKIPSSGTGRVHSIKRQEGSCPCEKCRTSKNPSSTWAEVEVMTAKHVVFDDFEARESSCRLFYDEPDSPEVILNGHRVTNNNIKEDRCILICVTCDLNLIDKLIKLEESAHSLFIQVTKKFKHNENKFICLVSHPHGQPKQISLGKWTDRKPVHQLENSKYCYDACTCPGSSGAYIFILGSLGWYYGHIHSAGGAKDNRSSYGTDFLPLMA